MSHRKKKLTLENVSDSEEDYKQPKQNKYTKIFQKEVPKPSTSKITIMENKVIRPATHKRLIITGDSESDEEIFPKRNKYACPDSRHDIYASPSGTKLHVMKSIPPTPLSIGTGHAYVLLQVRKGDNQSNVDAVIHKVVKNPKETESRKRLSKGIRYEINNSKGRVDRSGGLESIVLAINTGASPNQVDSESGVMKKAQELLVDFLKDETVNSFFRAKKDTYKVKPEIVHFRSGKPSLMLEVNFESVLGAIRDALRSKKVKTYADTLAQKAAIIYRTLRDDIKAKNRDMNTDNDFF